ncbi:hypothetical protein J3R82DRAFT_1300 [Butyriboletus roseoflavus]|nr:hypothetical protein J3R82DRAFT_1300 [Butyriboletus roseoflavus]
MNSGIQTGTLKKAIPNRAFLNVINEYKSMAEGAIVTDQPVNTDSEDNGEEFNGLDIGDDSDEQVNNRGFNLNCNDDLEGEQVDNLEWDDDQ